MGPIVSLRSLWLVLDTAGLGYGILAWIQARLWNYCQELGVLLINLEILSGNFSLLIILISVSYITASLVRGCFVAVQNISREVGRRLLTLRLSS